MGNAITAFLNVVPDKRHHENWKLAWTNQYCRYWFVVCPRCDNVPVKLFREFADSDLIQDVTDDYKTRTIEAIQFIYEAQRESGDW